MPNLLKNLLKFNRNSKIWSGGGIRRIDSEPLSTGLSVAYQTAGHRVQVTNPARSIKQKDNMRLITFYDTETTGFPDWKQPSESEQQPHIVSLSAIQCDADNPSGTIIQGFDYIVYPKGWKSSEEALKTHGITEEFATAVGFDESFIVNALLALCADSIRVAHNQTFDQRIVRIASKRYFGELEINEWARKDNHQCTMLLAKPIMQLLPKNKFGFKNPNLEEAYKHFCQKELGEKAHNSHSDVRACKDIWFAIQRW
jgi:DNA polymerase-3 subunit epsilon